MTYEDKINKYEANGGSQFLVKMFRSGNTGFNVRKLEDELRKQQSSKNELEALPKKKGR